MKKILTLLFLLICCYNTSYAENAIISEPIQIEVSIPTSTPTIEPTTTIYAYCYMTQHVFWVGETATIYAKVAYAPDDYTIVWERKKNGGSWEAIPGENSLSYTFIVEENFCDYSWRFSIYE